MTPPQSVSPPHQYPQAIQLKLYQAFIFSIPILFSIILFLLFYLFYLKRRASGLSTTSPILPRTTTDANITTSFDSEIKNELKNKLRKILFDDLMKEKDSVCCVCLGEFEMKEELLQVASCRHIFHIECIRHWLHNNSTCPLCRVPVLSDYYYFKSHQFLQPSAHPPNLTPPEYSEQVELHPQMQTHTRLCIRSEGSSSSASDTTG